MHPYGHGSIFYRLIEFFDCVGAWKAQSKMKILEYLLICWWDWKTEGTWRQHSLYSNAYHDRANKMHSLNYTLQYTSNNYENGHKCERATESCAPNIFMYDFICSVIWTVWVLARMLLLLLSIHIVVYETYIRFNEWSSSCAHVKLTETQGKKERERKRGKENCSIQFSRLTSRTIWTISSAGPINHWRNEPTDDVRRKFLEYIRIKICELWERTQISGKLDTFGCK